MSKEYPLIECFTGEEANLQIIEEARGNNSTILKAKGRFQFAEKRNANKRRYPKHILERELQKLKPFVVSRSLFGELDHPSIVPTSLQNASHIVTELYMDGPEVVGVYEVLNTSKGRDLRAILEANCKPGISSRGAGSLVKEDGGFCVAEDFSMKTFDVVADPSTFGAVPEVVSEQIIDVRESATQDKVADFVALLSPRVKNAIREALKRTNQSATLLEDYPRLVKCLEDETFIKTLRHIRTVEKTDFLSPMRQAGLDKAYVLVNKCFTENDTSKEYQQRVAGVYRFF